MTQHKQTHALSHEAQKKPEPEPAPAPEPDEPEEDTTTPTGTVYRMPWAEPREEGK